MLFVTETGTSLIDAYAINANGTPSPPLIQHSVGSSPFALAFTPQNNLLVTEVRELSGTALQGAVTSYQLSSNGTLTPISGSVPDSQTAPCWIVVTPDGKFAYVVNTASGVISGYQVGSNGVLSLLGDGRYRPDPAPALSTTPSWTATCSTSLRAVLSSDFRCRPTERSVLSST